MLVVAGGAWALTPTSITKRNSNQHSVAAQQPGEETPEHVRYMFLFHQHHFNMKKAAALEQQGKDGSRVHSMFKRLAVLNDHEALIFDQVASDCEQELEQQDARAKAVIDAFRARYPVDDPQAGANLPPPPPELADMQQERNAIILRARDRLHAELGDVKYANFNAFVKSLSISTERPSAAGK
jgi:hypothetical protein